jgi:hypothetical protein
LGARTPIVNGRGNGVFTYAHPGEKPHEGIKQVGSILQFLAKSKSDKGNYMSSWLVL